jgi:hypothetical protein
MNEMPAVAMGLYIPTPSSTPSPSRHSSRQYVRLLKIYGGEAYRWDGALTTLLR